MNQLWQLPYLGDRAYVHGTTLVDQILKEFAPDFPLDIRFQSPILGKVKVQSAPREKPNVAVTFDRNAQRVLYGLFDAGNPASDNRASFDERAIEALMAVGKGIVSSPHNADASLISRIVVMNKVLMSRLFPDARGKWWFAELRLKAWPAAAGSAQVEFDRGIGTRLVCSTIRVDGARIGTISFSLADASRA
jgi:hypothetical protein